MIVKSENRNGISMIKQDLGTRLETPRNISPPLACVVAVEDKISVNVLIFPAVI
jgi:hypothetical protein